MPRKKVDGRIRTLIENSIKAHQRSLVVLVGDHGRDQVRRMLFAVCLLLTTAGYQSTLHLVEVPSESKAICVVVLQEGFGVFHVRSHRKPCHEAHADQAQTEAHETNQEANGTRNLRL